MVLQTEKYTGEGFTIYRRALPLLVIPEHDHRLHTIHLHLGDPVVRESLSNGHSQSAALSAGTISLFPSGTHHAVMFQGAVDQLVVNIDPQRLVKGLGEPAKQGFLELKEQDQRSDARIEHLVRALYASAQEGDSAVSLCTESLLASLSLCIAQRYAAGRPPAGQRNFGMPRARLNRVLAVIEEKLADNIRLSELAQAAGMSVFHFAKLFKKSTGQSPYQYVLRRRIEIAKELLRNEAMSVLEVSARTGFVDQRHFTKVFRQKIGATPTAYRAAL